MKKCNNCNIEKNIIEFTEGRNKCKDCIREIKRKYYQDNRDRELSRIKKYREDNRDKIKNTDKKYYENNKEKVKKRVSEYRKSNSEKVKKKVKVYSAKNKEARRERYNKEKSSFKEKRKVYTLNNKEKINTYQRNYLKERRLKDDLFRISGNIRSVINSSLRGKGFSKKSKTQKILGCSFEELKLYLESKFEPWMTWKNHGKYNGELNYGWDIDHIIPLKSGNTEEEILQLSHFENLQPLCSKVNRDIKRDLL